MVRRRRRESRTRAQDKSTQQSKPAQLTRRRQEQGAARALWRNLTLMLSLPWPSSPARQSTAHQRRMDKEEDTCGHVAARAYACGRHGPYSTAPATFLPDPDLPSSTLHARAHTHAYAHAHAHAHAHGCTGAREHRGREGGKEDRGDVGDLEWRRLQAVGVFVDH